MEDQTSPHRMQTRTVEVHRPGTALRKGGILDLNHEYIVLDGDSTEHRDGRVGLDESEFRQCLQAINDRSAAGAAGRSEAVKKLGDAAVELLSAADWSSDGKPIHVDLVMGSAELWAFPFELLRVDDQPIVLTLRVRGAVPLAHRWPIKPRVLFAHAPDHDLSDALIESHQNALLEALDPWPKSCLKVERIALVSDLKRLIAEARESEPFTHVHVLAHGKRLPSGEPRWGLRLGSEPVEATSPERLADALEPRDGLPAVISFAACDVANQVEAWDAKRSLALDLHERGTPVVLASQFPLLEEASVTMTETFYNRILASEDVRLALHETRAALYKLDPSAPDWIGVVAYMQALGRYDQDRDAVVIAREMSVLKSLRDRVRFGSESESSVEELRAIESKLVDQTKVIAGHIDARPDLDRDQQTEYLGVFASAHKRLGEIRQYLASNHGEAESAERAIASFRDALSIYRRAADLDLNAHWPATQALSLQAALSGALDSTLWNVAFRAATNQRDAGMQCEWAHGTIVELELLRPLLGGPYRLDDARGALSGIVEAVRAEGDAYAIQATRDQLRRYIEVWTQANGFFSTREHDLSEPAAELVAFLDQAKEAD